MIKKRNRFKDYLTEEAENWFDTEDEVQQGSEPSTEETAEVEEVEETEEGDPLMEVFREMVDELSVIRKTLQMMNDRMAYSTSIPTPAPQETAAEINQPQSILSQQVVPTMESKQPLDDVNALL